MIEDNVLNYAQTMRCIPSTICRYSSTRLSGLNAYAPSGGVGSHGIVAPVVIVRILDLRNRGLLLCPMGG